MLKQAWAVCDFKASLDYIARPRNQNQANRITQVIMEFFSGWLGNSGKQTVRRLFLEDGEMRSESGDCEGDGKWSRKWIPAVTVGDGQRASFSVTRF